MPVKHLNTRYLFPSQVDFSSVVEKINLIKALKSITLEADPYISAKGIKHFSELPVTKYVLYKGCVRVNECGVECGNGGFWRKWNTIADICQAISEHTSNLVIRMSENCTIYITVYILLILLSTTPSLRT